jgi:hypothetical protein
MMTACSEGPRTPPTGTAACRPSKRRPTSASVQSSNSFPGASARAESSAATTCQKHSSRPVAAACRQPQTRTRRGVSCEAVTKRQTGRLSLQRAAFAADGTACRRPKPWNRASFANIAHLRFRTSRRSASVRVSDRLGAIAYPNAATTAAIRSRCLAVSPAWPNTPGRCHRRGYCPFARRKC